MTDPLFYYSYFSGRGRELLAEALDNSSPFTLPGSEIVERVLNAGYGPDLAKVQSAPFSAGQATPPVSHEGQTFLVVIDTEAELISVQEERATAYEIVEWRP